MNRFLDTKTKMTMVILVKTWIWVIESLIMHPETKGLSQETTMEMTLNTNLIMFTSGVHTTQLNMG